MYLQVTRHENAWVDTRTRAGRRFKRYHTYNVPVPVGLSVFTYGMVILITSMIVEVIFFGAGDWSGSQVFLFDAPGFVLSMLLSGGVARCLRPRIQRMRERGLYADDSSYAFDRLYRELEGRGIRVSKINDKKDFAFCGTFIRQYLRDTYEDSQLVRSKDITNQQRQTLEQGIDKLAHDTAQLIAENITRRDEGLRAIAEAGRAGIAVIEQGRAEHRRLTTQVYADEVIKRRRGGGMS